MTIKAVQQNVGKRFPHCVREQVLRLAGQGVNQAQLGIAAEIARRVGASAGVISPGQHGVVVLGLASQTASVDVAVHPDGGLSVSISMPGGDDWQGGKVSRLVRMALWGER